MTACAGFDCVVDGVSSLSVVNSLVVQQKFSFLLALACFDFRDTSSSYNNTLLLRGGGAIGLQESSGFMPASTKNKAECSLGLQHNRLLWTTENRAPCLDDKGVCL
jgi:hypothetical protein